MAPGQRPEDLYLTDSPTAWRVRIRVLDDRSAMTPVASATLERSHSGISRIFRAAFDLVVRAENADRKVSDLRLLIEHRELGVGNIGLWFDVRDERSRLARLVAQQEIWIETVDSLLGVASKELISVLRSQVMHLEAPAEQLIIRHIPGPGGPRSRVEVSMPGAPPSRMDADLWEWMISEEGRGARRDLMATLAAPGVAHMEIIFYEGQENEHVLQLDSSQELRDFVAGS